MVTDTPIPAAVCCFADPESKNINRLILIAPCLARASSFADATVPPPGRNRDTAREEWINLLADDGSDQPARSSIFGGG
jgi:hypothetical protein